MLDLRWVVQNLDEVKTRLESRGAGAGADLARIAELAAERKKLILSSEGLRAEQKKSSDEMRVLKGEAQAELRAKLKVISETVKVQDAALTDTERQIAEVLQRVPNLPHKDVPVGPDASGNVEQPQRAFGQKPTFDFKPKEHTDLGEALGLLDFERAVKLSGSRFWVAKGAIARLELALARFFLDLHGERGYQEVLAPYLVNAESMRGTGQLPKFEEDLFKTTTGHYLIPTAEVSVTNLHRDEILGDPNSPAVPVKYCSFSPCFRSEAGSAGKDTKGLIRVHQFHKVELVRFEAPENAHAALEELVSDAQEPLKRLGLHHKVVLLCSGDMGFGAEKTYDIEVWLPGQNAYREISSCSTFGDFQARRAQIRYRPSATEKPRLVNTLNGSGLAVGRTLVALLENGQQGDGSIALPEAIWPYMGGLKRIEAVKR
jgi:seryl-tRNA synthetase